MSFFDPAGPNPGRAGVPGRLAFAGTATARRATARAYPEKNWYGGFAPRAGAVYRLNDARCCVRAGGCSTRKRSTPAGAAASISVRLQQRRQRSSGLGGIQPAFYLEEGFPQNFQRPPFIESDFRNGQGVYYRPLDANKRPYAHQWNITVDREIGRNFSLSVGYVGSAGRRLPSSIEPLNALDPTYLSMGNQLYDEFEPGMTSLHGVPLPYAGWVGQMTGCAPSVAQALRPYPAVLRQPSGR